MVGLKVDKNKIVDANGNEVILRGININSPGILKYKENHNFLEDIKQIKNLSANAIRVPICPAYFQSKKDYCETILDPIVSLCEELELYCLLDYHGQGNPEKGLTREPKMLIDGFMKYDANYNAAKSAAETLAKKYGKKIHVLFEPLSAYFLDVTQEEYQSISSELTQIIRKHSENIIIVSAVDWPQTLEYALNYKTNISNIAFGIMVYPGTTNEIKKIITLVKKHFPIVITECGYERVNPKEEVFAGTKEYAVSLKAFLEENDFSWFAWCYHPTRQPVLLRSWSPNDLSEWGRFVKKDLL